MISVTENSEMSDEEIVALALRDQDNFVMIIDRYKGKLFNYIRRITSVRNEDVEDLLQEILPVGPGRGFFNRPRPDGLPRMCEPKQVTILNPVI